MNFRQTIEKARIKKGWSIPRLAREVGLNHQTLYKYLHGINGKYSEMTAKNIEKIFKALGI